MLLNEGFVGDVAAVVCSECCFLIADVEMFL